ncbi:hypothetical protein D8B26_007362 [Coccidioides posadasii str. Silveira]|uniref:C2H2-type domain-containing protein n=1 Tax=Coccidioides posadasii (strain RMSCC 757 / Silveira) TaxID=443226 RepID=E9D3K2_COCPS|nr:hypothetical protein CPSG_04743 [Coccidioides posadasii str. Silveira]QVM12745.1 hypothetical protein D8B26_007362 [Coccidioides posadasii str. Silveira]
MADSPGSPLSSLASEEFAEDLQFEDRAQSPSSAQVPPSKRRKIGLATWDHHTPISSAHDEIPPTSPASISSDSSAELPQSPEILSLIGGGMDEDYSGVCRDQVTVCQWDGCDANDLGHMDALVEHIHKNHIISRQKKYFCEWKDCPRKGQTHASGYALRAHMRSHTKEKPFYCTLPECDRSFTRSDALSKHMRTVHETEALKLSDTLAKHTQVGPAGPTLIKLPRIKLKLSQSSRDGCYETDKNGGEDVSQKEPVPSALLDSGLGFDAHELSLPLSQLYRVLRRQIFWAEQESKRLQLEWQRIKIQRKETWREKETILEDVIHAEVKLFQSALTAEDLALARGVSDFPPAAP